MISSIYSTTNLNNLKQFLCFDMNLKTKGKGNFISDIYVNSSDAGIWNDLVANRRVSISRYICVEVSHTGREVAMGVFHCELSKKSILIGEFQVLHVPTKCYFYFLSESDPAT